jgi:predicted transcriptional regulator/transcriptional regulator with XRE-family HTH domain
MARAPIGQRIRKRRQELAVSQKALAARVGISSSYLNLIEHNKRPIGGALLNQLATALDLDSRALAGTEEARLIAELGEVANDPVLAAVGMAAGDGADIVATSPQAARAILAVYRAYREAKIRSELIGERLGEESFLAEASHQILALITTIRSYSEILKDYGDLSDAERRRFVVTLVEESERLAAGASDMFDFMSGRGSRRPHPSPREEIEDFVSDNANYFPRLEAAAEAMLGELDGGFGATHEALCERLNRRHAVAVARGPAADLPAGGERLEGRAFLLADRLGRVSTRFRLARLLGRLEHGRLIDELVAGARLTSAESALPLRRALASYFAGALIMPYAEFHAAAEACRHDVMAIGRRFDVSFEQACHRLTTLRRAGAEGVPLHFLRTDIAGNISKRFSASGLTLPRYGGACPRWIIHHAFASPGRVVTQVAELPDGERYLFVARADIAVAGESAHAVMIGAAIAHAGRFAYADGLDLEAPAVPVGVTCRSCGREDCAARAFERAPVLPPAAAVRERAAVT